jgi:hypothetical protein
VDDNDEDDDYNGKDGDDDDDDNVDINDDNKSTKKMSSSPEFTLVEGLCRHIVCHLFQFALDKP